MSVSIIHEKCDPELSDNSSLPTNSFLVCYLDNEEQKYDIVQASTMSSVFDKYYDTYKKVISIDWTKGKFNSRMYKNPNQPEPPKRKRK